MIAANVKRHTTVILRGIIVKPVNQTLAFNARRKL